MTGLASHAELQENKGLGPGDRGDKLSRSGRKCQVKKDSWVIKVLWERLSSW
jgi:hypothetical protein